MESAAFSPAPAGTLLVRRAGRARSRAFRKLAAPTRRAALAQDRAEEEVPHGEGAIEVDRAVRLVFRFLVTVQGQEERSPQVVKRSVQGMAAKRRLRDPFRRLRPARIRVSHHARARLLFQLGRGGRRGGDRGRLLAVLGPARLVRR
jgi:hypothetical protein